MTVRKNKHYSLFSIILLAAILLCTVLQSTDALSRKARERLYADTVAQAAQSYDVPQALVLAVIRAESDFQKDALSHVGAVGLMQLMPETFVFLTHERLGEDLSPDAAWDPEVNIRYGTYYLSYLLSRFPQLETALAAYNAGEGNVEKWLQEQNAEGGVLVRIPFAETEQYVAKVLKFYGHYQKMLD